MNTRRVLIVGNSIFAETLGQLLANTQGVTVVGAAETPQVALRLIPTCCPDVVIVAACTGSAIGDEIGPFLVNHPHLPIIRTDLTTNSVQVITSRWISARSADLLETLAELPKLCE